VIPLDVRRRLLRIARRRLRQRQTTSPALSAAGFERPGAGASSHDVICFSIIDWNFRFQRPQQLLSRLGASGHRVFYLAQTFRSHGPLYEIRVLGPQIYEVSLRGADLNPYADALDEPKVAPLFSALDALRRDFALEASVSLVELPFWWPLAARARAAFDWPIVYDCLDDHSGFETNRAEMVREEEELVAGADCIIASSRPLLERISSTRPDVELLRNGCDYEHFARVAESPRGERKVIGYFGAIAEWFDAELVAELAARRREWDFVLVGSTFGADLGRLPSQPNVRLAGEQPYADLPDWISGFDALILPFKRMPVTESTNPVKAYEILASGRPLVSVRLPEMIELAPLVRLASSAEEFERELEAALAEADPEEIARRREFARANTWEQRVKHLSSVMREALSKRAGGATVIEPHE
jgi:hypothetical protein